MNPLHPAHSFSKSITCVNNMSYFKYVRELSSSFQYSPISPLTVISKLFGSMYIKFVDRLNKNVMDDKQSGFHSNRFNLDFSSLQAESVTLDNKLIYRVALSRGYYAKSPVMSSHVFSHLLTFAIR